MKHFSPLVRLEQKADKAIRATGLLRPGDRIVVAVSGGPDSVALLRCLVALREQWNWDICLGHVNHGLRGAESEEDVDFVKALAEKFHVPALICRLYLNKQVAGLHKQSLQEYARTARYQALEEMIQNRKANKLALGHTADDQAETVLMWMLRGCGTGGLGGMPPKRGASVVRPLLDIHRSEILDYLKEREEDFRVDSTNVQPVYLRNRIRQDLIPHLKSYSRGIVHVLTRQAHILRDEHRYLEEIACEALLRICVLDRTGERHFDRLALLAVPLPIRRRVVRQSLRHVMGNTKYPRFEIVDRVLDRLQHGQSGWMIETHGVRIGQEYDRLVIRRHTDWNLSAADVAGPINLPLPIPGEVLWFPTGQHMKIAKPPYSGISKKASSGEIHLDPGTFTPELRVRSWVPGDVFCPKGLGGRQKKLQDLFSDMKLPRGLRTKVPLLTAPEGILWVGGLRADERFQVSSSTTSVMVATLTGESEN